MTVKRQQYDRTGQVCVCVCVCAGIWVDARWTEDLQKLFVSANCKGNEENKSLLLEHNLCFSNDESLQYSSAVDLEVLSNLYSCQLFSRNEEKA